MNSYTVELIWTGKEWLEPATSIKLTGIKAENKKGASIKVGMMIIGMANWKVVNVQEEA